MTSDVPYQYSASTDDHRQSASELVKVLVDCFHPGTMVDFGCGLGNFVVAFQKHGVEALGIDGAWAKQSRLFRLKNENDFRIVDLEKPVLLEKRFDLALSLEVAEHLSPEAADTFVKSLTDASDLIILSAAVPGQGGIHHVNEQWPEYWKEKFLARDFIFYDVLKPLVWNNENIKWYYRQNLFVFAHKTKTIDHEFFERLAASSGPINYLHPGSLQDRNAELQKLYEGRERLKFYIRMLLSAVKRRLGR